MNRYLIVIAFLLVSSPPSWADRELPVRLHKMILKNTSISDILYFCQTSKRRQMLCDENEKLFWQALVKRDFGQAYIAQDTSNQAPWKQIYFNADEIFFGRFVTIPGGTYEIGSPPNETSRSIEEKLHAIGLSEFEIMSSAVTQAHYVRLMGVNPSRFQKEKDCPASFKKIKKGEKEIPVCLDHPVEGVSWFDAKKFAEILSESSKIYNYALPTEAQLEVAFRGGAKTAYAFGDDASNLKDYVRFWDNSDRRTHPVKSLTPNAYGVYRGGGVWEWVWDWYGEYDGSFAQDPTGPASGSRRILRGCAWYNQAQDCRSAHRYSEKPEVPGDGFGNQGFRLVRTKK